MTRGAWERLLAGAAVQVSVPFALTAAADGREAAAVALDLVAFAFIGFLARRTRQARRLRAAAPALIAPV